MSNQLQLSGAQPVGPVRYAPIFTNRFFQGLWTQRNPMRDAGSTRIEEKFYGARGDAMIAGSNVEISNRLTPVRRPGSTEYNSSTFSAIDSFYEFRLFNPNTESILVMADTASALYEATGPTNKNLVWTKSAGAGQTYMQYVANTLYFGDGVDQKKWLQTLNTWTANTLYSLGDLETFFIDPNGNIQQVINCIFAVSSVVVTSGGPAGSDFSNTVTVTVTSDQPLTSVLSPGLETNFSGLSAGNNTWLNGITPPLTITSVGSTTFSAGTNHATYSATADTGLGNVVQGGNPYSGTSAPIWNVSLLGTTNDTNGGGTAQWINRGGQIENWGIAAPTVAPTINVGASISGWKANTYYGNSSISFPITQVQVSTDTLTITTSATLTNLLSANSFVNFKNVANASFLNGQSVEVLTVSTHAFTATIQNANYGPTADSGTFSQFTACIIDSNGNIQKVTTPGISGSSVPSWASSVGSNTTDNTVTWTCLQLAPLAWQSHTVYPPGTFITATVNGVPCLFQGSNPTTAVQLSGAVTSYFWPRLPAEQGAFGRTFPLSTGTASATATGNSLLFNPPQLTGTPDPNVQPLQWATLNGAGAITGYTTPWSGATTHYDMVVVGDLVISAPGNYTFNINHDDGMFFGIGPGVNTTDSPLKVSGPSNNPFTQTITAVQGYTVMGANNISGNNNDTYTIFFPAADTYPFEIDYAQFETEQQLTVAVNGHTPVTGPIESGAISPVFPLWTTTFAPNYPTVSESLGQILWTNIGPIADHIWHASTNFSNTESIIDANGNIQAPYEAGVSGTTQPAVWSTGLNQLTKDAPNLIWINIGQGAASPTGTLSTFNGGWSYAIALVNTLTNAVSDASPITLYTGNFVGTSGVTITGGLPMVIDPQVDQVAIFRTKDGGANWYLIPGLGNTIYTTTLSAYEASGYVDTTLDANLNILIQAPLADQNAVPPVGLINLTYHLNRIFGSVGNTVFWSTGPDTPVGNGVEGFLPSNSAVFPSLVKRIVPTSIGALIFTVSDIYLLAGQATANSPLFPQPYASGIGLLSYNALAVNGTVIYFFTSDSQVISLDPSSGVSQIGFPIGDQFDGTGTWSGAGTPAVFNPANAYVTWHVSGSQDQALYVSDGATGWFRMTPTASPESGLTWSPFATITGGCKAIESIEVAPGVHRLLIGPTSSGPILQRDLSTWADNGADYLANFTIGSIVLAQPGQIAELAFLTLDSQARGTRPVLGARVGEIAGLFETLTNFTQDPPQLAPSLTVYSQRFYFSQTQAPALCRHIQILTSWPAEDVQNELMSMTIFGAYAQEI